jgi:hypothetical protein
LIFPAGFFVGGSAAIAARRDLDLPFGLLNTPALKRTRLRSRTEAVMAKRHCDRVGKFNDDMGL